MEWQGFETACGSPLFLYRMPGRKIAAFAVLAKVGTRDEKWPSEAGFAHAFEHMPFRGTIRFPSSKALTAYLEDVGGNVNAFTAHESTDYYAIVPRSAYEKGVIVLSELVCNPLLRDEDVVIERQAIIEEIHRRRDNPMAIALDRSQELLYNEHVLARSVLGIEDIIREVGAEQLRCFSKKFYNPANLVFFAVGDFDAAQIRDVFDRQFVFSATPIVPHLRSYDARGPISESKSETRRKEIEQAHLVLAAWVPSQVQIEGLVLDVFNRMLGAGMSFPIFQEIRNQRGLCYEVWTATEFFTDNGIFKFYAGVDPKRVEEARDVFFEIIGNSKTDSALLERAKGNALGRFDLVSENPGSIIGLAVADVVFYEYPRTLDEHKQQIVSVGIEEVEEAVNRYLRPELFAQSYVVPKEKV